MPKTRANNLIKDSKRLLTRKQYKGLTRLIQENRAEEAIKELRAILLFGGSNAIK